MNTLECEPEPITVKGYEGRGEHNSLQKNLFDHSSPQLLSREAASPPPRVRTWRTNIFPTVEIELKFSKKSTHILQHLNCYLVYSDFAYEDNILNKTWCEKWYFFEVSTFCVVFAYYTLPFLVSPAWDSGTCPEVKLLHSCPMLSDFSSPHDRYYLERRRWMFTRLTSILLWSKYAMTNIFEGALDDVNDDNSSTAQNEWHDRMNLWKIL
jgi:hypothetical protein